MRGKARTLKALDQAVCRVATSGEALVRSETLIRSLGSSCPLCWTFCLRNRSLEDAARSATPITALFFTGPTRRNHFWELIEERENSNPFDGERRLSPLSWARCCLCSWLQVGTTTLTGSEDEWDLFHDELEDFMTWIYSSLRWGRMCTGLSLRQRQASGWRPAHGPALLGRPLSSRCCRNHFPGLSSQPLTFSPRSMLFSLFEKVTKINLKVSFFVT